MARITKRDRLAKIKQAGSYPTTKEAIEARLSAAIKQSTARPLGDVPVAEEAPKHLSAAYTRNSVRRHKVSNWLEKYRQYIVHMQWTIANFPALRPKINPAMKPPLPVSTRGYRDIGPICTEPQGSTHSRVHVEPLLITPELISRCESIVRTIPADTPSPEQRATREWAEWVIATPERIEAGRIHSELVAETRQQSQRVGVRIAAANSRDEERLRRAAKDAISTYGPSQSVKTPGPYFSATPSHLCKYRVPLSSLVPMAKGGR